MIIQKLINRDYDCDGCDNIAEYTLNMSGKRIPFCKDCLKEIFEKAKHILESKEN